MSALASSASAAPSPIRIWMRAVRIFSFTASITPVADRLRICPGGARFLSSPSC